MPLAPPENVLIGFSAIIELLPVIAGPGVGAGAIGNPVGAIGFSAIGLNVGAGRAPETFPCGTAVVRMAFDCIAEEPNNCELDCTA
jgi:hypothetical protein